MKTVNRLFIYANLSFRVFRAEIVYSQKRVFFQLPPGEVRNKEGKNVKLNNFPETTFIYCFISRVES